MAISKETGGGEENSSLALVELNVLDIYLDSANPRHNPIAEQNKIIAHLLKKEKVRNLARDISQEGLSPLELFAVIRDDKGNYVAVEGNRRLCALTLLNDPSAAPEADRQYYQKLAENSPALPTHVNCVEFASREAADGWILRRHGGEQDGVGTKQWDATQISRHKSDKNKPNYNALALSVIDYAVTEGILPSDNREKILTTVARYLGNPYFRKTLGIVSGRSDSEVIVNVTYDDFDRVIGKFFQDLMKPKSAVNSRSNKEDWEAYAASLVSKGFAPGQHGAKQKLAEKSRHRESKKSSTTEETAPPARKAGQKSGARSPDKRQYIVPSEFRPSVKNKMLKRILDEMKSISVDDYPLAVSLLTRAFLENLYHEFHGKMVSHFHGETHKLLLKVIKVIENFEDCSKAEIKALGALRRVQSNENNVLSPKTLGANAHANHYPNATELKREWDNVSAILDYMLRKLTP